MNCALLPALFAPSGPATTLHGPLAELFRVLGEALLHVVGHERGDCRAPHPGRSPRKKPTTVDRIMVTQVSRMSRQVGSQSLIRVS